MSATSGFLVFGANAGILGLLAHTLERWEAAQAHFEAALAFNARMGARPLVVQTQYDYARMLLDRGAPADRGRAEALLADALPIATELGMAPLIERIGRLQAELPDTTSA